MLWGYKCVGLHTHLLQQVQGSQVVFLGGVIGEPHCSLATALLVEGDASGYLAPSLEDALAGVGLGREWHEHLIKGQKDSQD